MDSPPSSELRRSPPSLRGAQILRALPSIVRDPIGFIASARAIHGDVYTVDLGVRRAVLLNQPRHAQHVLADNADNYKKSGPLLSSIRALSGNGLLVSEGDFWRRQRRMIQPELHEARLALVAERMVDAIRDGMAGWDAAAAEGKPLDLSVELANITRKVIVRAMFGAAIDRAEEDRAFEELGVALDYVLRGFLLRSLPAWLPTPGRRRHQQAVAAIDEILFRLIEQRRRDQGPRDALISLLLDMVDPETQEQMKDEELRDEVLSIFLGGHETTAGMLSWAAHHLAREPEIARAQRAEVDAALGGREPSFADLPRLPETRAILKESLRLYPPVYWLPRESLADDEIDGWSIPKGTLVAPVVYAIHRHPDLWEEPDSFDPGRFSKERSEGRHPLSWMPFGAGQRLCVGRDLALLEGQMILARIAQRYELSPVDRREARPRMGTTLRADGGVWVELKRR